MKKERVVQPIHGDHTHVGGLDASTSRIGYCAPNGTMHSVRAHKLPRHPTPFDLGRRCHELKAGLARTVRINPPAPTLMIYEQGFAGQFPGSAARLDELRGVLRQWMIEAGIEFVEVNNVYVKQFAAGKSDADKTVMTHAATSQCRRLGLQFGPANDDEADAWHLRGLGRVGLGLDEPYAEFQADAVARCGVVFL